MRVRAAALHVVNGMFFLWHLSDRPVPGASAVDCICSNISLCRNQCTSSKGIQEFQCFGKIDGKKLEKGFYCTWRTGRSAVNHSYTLRIEQKARSTCSRISSQMSSDMVWTSTKFRLRENQNMSAHLIANSRNSTCAMATISGLPAKMVHCGPPMKVNFTRHEGHLNIQALWGLEAKKIKQFSVNYKEHNSSIWKKVLSVENNNMVLRNLTTSLFYDVQIQCVVNTACPHCPSGQDIIVPPELTEAPVLKWLEDHPFPNGQRKVMIQWEHAQPEAVEKYNVSVTKLSGEISTDSNMTLAGPSLHLTLSYSAFKISIQAWNSAGSSPSMPAILQAVETQDWGRQLHVSIESQSSFSLAWSSTVAQEYCCYSVEWYGGEKAGYKSFYLTTARHVITQSGFFEKYKRYRFFLHTRQEKETCNLKRINNSEITYGRAEAYLAEGTPLSAPENISTSNVTQTSCVVTWSTVPEELLRGFLLGYVISYAEDSRAHAETNITVDPGLVSYKLADLRRACLYRVQLSAYTAAGAGIRSLPVFFETNASDSLTLSGVILGITVGIIVFLLVVHLFFRLMRRAKKVMWPSIPKPGNSNAVQRIELEILEPLSQQKLREEEWDSSSFCVIESRNDVSDTLISQDSREPFMDPQRRGAESSTTWEDLQPPPCPTDSVTQDHGAREFIVDDSPLSTAMAINNASPATEHLAANSSTAGTGSTPDVRVSSQMQAPPAFVSNYTTMELFHQATMATSESPPMKAETVLEGRSPVQDYIR